MKPIQTRHSWWNPSKKKSFMFFTDFPMGWWSLKLKVGFFPWLQIVLMDNSHGEFERFKTLKFMRCWWFQTNPNSSYHKRNILDSFFHSSYCWWGKNPAPVDMVNIPLFTGFHTCQVVSRISFINSLLHECLYFTKQKTQQPLRLDCTATINP